MTCPVELDVANLRNEIRTRPRSIVAVIEMRGAAVSSRLRSYDQGDRPMDAKTHWERVYATKRSEELSWYQGDPAPSLRLLDHVGIGPNT